MEVVLLEDEEVRQVSTVEHLIHAICLSPVGRRFEPSERIRDVSLAGGDVPLEQVIVNRG